MTFSQLRYAALAIVVSFIVLACRGVDEGDGSGGSTGELTIGISDGPVETADSISLSITGLEITPTGGTPILIEDLREDFVNLLDFQGAEREELIRRYDLPDGSYESIRLIIDDTASLIRLKSNGEEYELTIPAGEEANLLLDLNIVFSEDNDREDFTIEFDLRKSLRVDDAVSPPVYELHPRLRIVETSRGETLRGTVHEDLIENDPNCSNGSDNRDGNAVYLYVGDSGEELDIRDEGTDPYATATVDLNNGVWEFEFGFLPVNSYRAVFTCNATLDDPEVNDQPFLDFSVAQPISVQQGNTETLSFLNN